VARLVSGPVRHFGAAGTAFHEIDMRFDHPRRSGPLEAAEFILKINNIEVRYHEVILVLKGVSIVVPEGGIVALLGANGAGKSTILKAISGLLNPRGRRSDRRRHRV
jgi:ABC-type polysaccharide/polyol phosphate transport system ATPase subunit